MEQSKCEPKSVVFNFLHHRQLLNWYKCFKKFFVAYSFMSANWRNRNNNGGSYVFNFVSMFLVSNVFSIHSNMHRKKVSRKSIRTISMVDSTLKRIVQLTKCIDQNECSICRVCTPSVNCDVFVSRIIKFQATMNRKAPPIN